MQQRIANVVYILSIIAACVFVALAPFVYADDIKRFDASHAALVSSIPLGYAALSLTIGWFLRYILTGTKKLKPEL